MRVFICARVCVCVCVCVCACVVCHGSRLGVRKGKKGGGVCTDSEWRMEKRGRGGGGWCLGRREYLKKGGGVIVPLYFGT